MKPRYNCLTCPGYCCSHPRIAVSEYDIARLARHFTISPNEARRRFTYRYRTKETDEQILRHQKDHIYKSICRFFDTDKRCCTIYAARPATCRSYPGNRCGYYDFLSFERAAQEDKEFISTTWNK